MLELRNTGARFTPMLVAQAFGAMAGLLGLITPWVFLGTLDTLAATNPGAFLATFVAILGLGALGAACALVLALDLTARASERRGEQRESAELPYRWISGGMPE